MSATVGPMIRRVALLVPFALLVGCSSASTPKAAPSPTVNTQAAADEARVACRFFTPDSLDPTTAQKFADDAFAASQMDSRWSGLSDAASAWQTALHTKSGLVQAITDADTACKEVP